MVLFLHNRYRTTGGEERVVRGPARARARAPRRAGRAAHARLRRARPRRAAAVGLLRGGLGAEEVAAAVRRAGARVVHAHNLQPGSRLAGSGGGPWRGRAGRAAPAPVQARLRGRGVLHRGRGVHPLPSAQHASRASAQLPRQPSRRRSPTAPRWRSGSGASVAQADAVVVPSRFAARRLRELGAPLADARVRRAGAAGDEPDPPSGRRAAPRAATPWSSRGWLPRRAWTWRSRPAGGRGCPW